MVVRGTPFGRPFPQTPIGGREAADSFHGNRFTFPILLRRHSHSQRSPGRDDERAAPLF